MCIWPCRAAHHFSSSYCLKRNTLCLFASYQKPGSHVELWRDGLVTSPGCQGEVQPVQRLSLSWGISGVLPALQSEVQMDCCSFSFAFCHDSAVSPWSHHAPRAQGSVQCCEGQRWGRPMAQPEVCIQSLPWSPVGCSCLQNHQLELFSLLFFGFNISQLQ